MQSGILRRRLSSPWAIAVVLLLFVVAGLIRYWSGRGDDLSSSFVGCRLVATHHEASLYSSDPNDFSKIAPGASGETWARQALAGNYRSFLHPYVQTPLWAYALQPVCTRTDWRQFYRIFAVLVLVSFAASVWLIVRYWAPVLFHPLAIGIVLLGLWYSQPFGYAMFLMQTHVLFFLMTLAALVLAERECPIAAGLLLACAAAVKLTPGVLVFYWLLTHRWKAAVSTLAWSGTLFLATLLAVGSHLTTAYLTDLHRVSGVLLLSLNNQSFAAWAASRFYSPDEIYDFAIYPLSPAIRWSSMFLMVACTVGGGLIDRTRQASRELREQPASPIGAMVALVAMTIFAPIAWAHYFIILVAPLMVLWQQSRTLRSPLLAILAAAVALLNFAPFAPDVVNIDIGTFALARAQFYAGVLCLAALVLAAWKRQRTRVLAEVEPLRVSTFE